MTSKGFLLKIQSQLHQKQQRRRSKDYVWGAHTVKNEDRVNKKRVKQKEGAWGYFIRESANTHKNKGAYFTKGSKNAIFCQQK